MGRRSFVLCFLAVAFACAVFQPMAVQAQASGWLEVRQTQGQVIITSSPPKAAIVGDRLSKSGDALETGADSSAILVFDRGIGTINVAEKTNLSIRRLAKLRSGARVTTLNLKKGQVRLNVRKFNNPASRLEIKSPAGVAAVRGTDYGISLSRDGRMVVGTASGLVTAAALGETIYLESDFGSRLRPSQLPSSPRLLDHELWVKLDSTEINGNLLSFRGSVDPLNSVILAGEEAIVDDNGRFEASLPLIDSTSIFDFDLEVRNALGESRRHSLIAW